jgi:hypothetical protein
MRTVTFSPWNPRTTTSLAIAPRRTFHTPARPASASPTSRAPLSRTRGPSSDSRSAVPTTVTVSTSVAISSVMSAVATAPAAASTEIVPLRNPSRAAVSWYRPGGRFDTR